MYCSLCNDEAEFKCFIDNNYFCLKHKENHLEHNLSHNGENLDINLEKDSFNKLKTNFINIAKRKQREIHLIHNLFLKLITAEIKATINQYENESKKILDLLKHNKFCSSDILNIENFEKTQNSLLQERVSLLCVEIKKISNDSLKNELKDSIIKNFFKDHSGGFWCGVVSKDCKKLITGGFDCTIRVFDLIQNIQELVLFGHNSYVKTIVNTEDSNIIISGSFDASIRIWDLEERKQVRIIPFHKNPVYSICNLGEPTLYASGEFGNKQSKLIIWDYKTFTKLDEYTVGINIFSLAFMHIEKILIACSNSRFDLFNLKTRNSIKILKFDFGCPICVSLTSNEKKMFTGSHFNSIICWDLAEIKTDSQNEATVNKVFEFPKVHEDWIRSLAISLNDENVVSGSGDGNIGIFSIANQNGIKLIKESYRIHSILNFGCKFLSLSFNSKILEVEIEMNNNTYDFKCKSYIEPLNPFNVYSATISSSLRYIGYGSENMAIVWDVERKIMKQAFTGHFERVWLVEISYDLRFAISCSEGKHKNLIYWNLNTGETISELNGHNDIVYCVCLTRDGFTAASGSKDKTVRLWNLRKCIQEYIFEGQTDPIRSLKFSNNNKYLVSAGYIEVIVWDLNGKEKYDRYTNHNYQIYKIFISDDNKYIYSADLYDGIIVYNIIDRRIEKKISFEDKDSCKWLIITVNQPRLLRFLKSYT